MTAISIPARRLALPGSRRLWLVVLVLSSAVLYVAFAGHYVLPHDNDAATFDRINEFRAWIETNRNSNVVLSLLVGGIRLFLNATYDGILALLESLSWAGLTAIGGAIGFLVGRWRMAGLVAAAFLSFGVLGLWEASVRTLALALTAVAFSLLIGIPLGIIAGRNQRFYDAIRPILDTMQIMPTFAYLAPVALFFLIGTATAVIVTVVYAIAPAVRITALGIRGVAAASVEAATSLGATRRQVLAKVQLPMARRTIVLGINQTIMMALSMVVITALVNAPGLGQDIINAIRIANVGKAFDAGLAVVIMAIMLDRLTSRASERLDPARSGTIAPITRRIVAIAVAVSAGAVLAGTFVLGGSEFPEALGFTFADPVNDLVAWIAATFFDATEWLKNTITYGLINPVEGLLTSAPWWLVVAAAAAITFLTGGLRTAAISTLCLLAIIGVEMWEHSMQTLTQVLAATVLTLLVGLVFGILSARSDRFSMVLRPFLDAAQTMPAFVYIVPALALFGPTRFTGIFAAVIYAIPPVIRLVEIGIRTVPPAVREAGVSVGASGLQLLRKVELPMALPALLVAANQGIIMVLAMVVVGGLVGAGALGYDVVAGFVRRDFFGEGLAAAFAIVLLGIMLDRISQSAGTQRASSSVSGTVARRAA
ncbi:MAG: transporter permease protein [Chloroflexi bacterium]|nr:transporter permease protein [Chloroflexota bacterium]